MSQSLLDLLMPPSESGRFFGVVTAFVTNNKDPKKRGRVKVHFPWLPDDSVAAGGGNKGVESDWVRVAMPMAGGGRGCFFLPEVDDEVLVAFEHGDIRFPYVVGSLWNDSDAPPEANVNGKNDLRLIKSRSGHIIRLDDTKDSEQIEIVDKDGKNRITISTAKNTITISADSDIVIEAKNGALKLSGQSVEITSKSSLKVNAHGNMQITGSSIDLN